MSGLYADTMRAYGALFLGGAIAPPITRGILSLYYVC